MKSPNKTTMSAQHLALVLLKELYRECPVYLQVDGEDLAISTCTYNTGPTGATVRIVAKRKDRK